MKLVESYIFDGNLRALTEYLKGNIDYSGLDEGQKERLLKLASNAKSIGANGQDTKNRNLICQILQKKFEALAAAKQSTSLDAALHVQQEDYELIEPSGTDEMVSDSAGMFSTMLAFMFGSTRFASSDNSNEAQVEDGPSPRPSTG